MADDIQNQYQTDSLAWYEANDTPLQRNGVMEFYRIWKKLYNI